MEYAEFHNALRILRSIDQDELVNAGVLPDRDHNAWGEFRRNPFMWFVRAPDTISKRLFEIIKERNEKAPERNVGELKED